MSHDECVVAVVVVVVEVVGVVVAGVVVRPCHARKQTIMYSVSQKKFVRLFLSLSEIFLKRLRIFNQTYAV